MNKSQIFKQAIKSGRGEAILLLKLNRSLNMDESIIEACTHNLAYDPQCEGSREEYLFDILSLSQNREAIEIEIFKALSNAKEESWGTELLFYFRCAMILIFVKNEVAIDPRNPKHTP